MAPKQTAIENGKHNRVSGPMDIPASKAPRETLKPINHKSTVHPSTNPQKRTPNIVKAK